MAESDTDEGHQAPINDEGENEIGKDGFIHAGHFDMNEVETTEVKEAADESDNDEPEVEDIKDKKITADNHTTCNITENDKLAALKEVFDEETCTNLLVGFYEACSKFFKKLQMHTQSKDVSILSEKTMC